MILTGNAGSIMNVIPDGINSVFSVNNLGDVVAKKIDLDQNSVSTMGAVSLFGNATFKEHVIIEKSLDLTGVASKVVEKHSVAQIIPANIGSGATILLQIDNKREIFLDGSNGGVQLVPAATDCTINLDMTNVIAGQKFTFRLLKKNATNRLKLLNGDATAPLFAKIDYAVGYQDIAFTVFPEFDDVAVGSAWLTCQWVEISAGVFRLVILDSRNVLNI